MKLLYDQNLSFKLVSNLKDLYPDSVHVREIGFARATDLAIWGYAAENDFVVVSKDDDLSSAFDSPRSPAQGGLAPGWKLHDLGDC